jgi:hypothetical protein
MLRDVPDLRYPELHPVVSPARLPTESDGAPSVGRRVFPVLALLVFVLAQVGCEQALDSAQGFPDREFNFSYPVHDSIGTGSGPVPSVNKIHTWGLQSDSPFGVINHATLMGDSLIAVADRVGCAIHILDIRAPDAPAQTIGGCGDGPGELRGVMHLAFDGEALLATDLPRGRVHRLDAAGSPVEPAWLDLRTISGAMSATVDGVDGIYLAAPGRSFREVGRPAFLVHGWEPDAVHVSLDPAIQMASSANVLVSGAGCLARGGDVVVVANHWLPEIALIARGPVVLGRIHVPSEWATPRLDAGPATWTPGSAPPIAVCSEGHAVVRYAVHGQSDAQDQTRQVNLGYLVFLDLDGRRVSHVDISEARWPDLGAHALAALQGRYLLTYQNVFGPVPTVTLWEIEGW